MAECEEWARADVAIKALFLAARGFSFSNVLGWFRTVLGQATKFSLLDFRFERSHVRGLRARNYLGQHQSRERLGRPCARWESTNWNATLVCMGREATHGQLREFFQLKQPHAGVVSFEKKKRLHCIRNRGNWPGNPW